MLAAYFRIGARFVNSPEDAVPTVSEYKAEAEQLEREGELEKARAI